MNTRHLVRAALAMLIAALPTLALPGEPAGKLTIEQRLQRVEDELAIRRVLVDYSATQDAHDYAGYAELGPNRGVTLIYYEAKDLPHATL